MRPVDHSLLGVAMICVVAVSPLSAGPPATRPAATRPAERSTEPEAAAVPLDRDAEKALSNMRMLIQGCLLWMNSHKNVWPDNLRQAALLAADGNERRADAVSSNPRNPNARPGFIHIQPPSDMPDWSRRLVLYEDYEDFADGIAVAFADGHATMVTDEHELLRLIDLAQKGSPAGK